MTISVFLLATALSAGNAEFDRTAVEGAARISFARASAELVRTGLPTGGLSRAMLEDPVRFRARSAAETASRELYAEAVEQAFREESDRIRARLGLASSFALPVKDADRQALLDRFPQAFSAERQVAVGEQAKGLATAVRPSEEEFETKSEDLLRRELTERVLAEQKTPVFEENREFVSDRIVGPILASAREERTRQENYLKRTRSDTPVPSKMVKDLADRLYANVAARRREADPTKAWNVFPSVIRQRLPEIVDHRIIGRFAGFVEAVQLEVTPESVADVIGRNPYDHIKAAESEKAFSQLYSEQILSTAIEKALADLPLEDRAEVRSFLTVRTQEEVVRKSVDRVVRRDVMPKWKVARDDVARRMADTLWPTLSDGTWCPSVELADALVARSDYDAAVKAWRTLDDLGAFARAGSGTAVLEEADGLADSRIGASFDRARRAIVAQNAIVDRVQAEVLEASRKSKCDLKATTERLTQKVTAAWTDERLTVLWSDETTRPANADDQYVALFPSVVRKIELVARQILEEKVEVDAPKPEEERKPDEKPEETKPEEPPPDEPPPEEPPPENPPEEEPEELFALSVKRAPGGIEVKLLQGKRVVKESVVPAKDRDFQRAMQELSRVLSTEVLNLR